MKQGRREAAVHTRGSRVGRKLFAQLAVLGLVIGTFAALMAPTVSASEDGPTVPCENVNVDNVSSARRGGIVAVCKDGPATATAGSDIQYTLTVYAPSWHDDSATTTDYGHTYVITDDLQPGVIYKSVVAPNIWDCSFSDPTVTCTATDVKRSEIDGGIIIINATIDPAYDPAADGDTITNCGTITKVRAEEDATTDHHFGPWTSCVDTTIDREADITIEKTSAATSLIVPNDIVYTVTAKNNGPSNSDPVRFTDHLPSGSTLAGVSGSAWDCSASSGTVVDCTTLAGLAAGDSASVELTVSVPDTQAGHDLTNCAVQEETETVANVAVNVQSCTTIAGENVTVKAAEAVTGLQPRFTG